MRVISHKLYVATIDSLRYIFVADSMGHCESDKSAPKTAVLCEITRNDGCSRSLKVTDFGTGQKHAYCFILVNNANLYPISHRFRVNAAYWSNHRF